MSKLFINSFIFLTSLSIVQPAFADDDDNNTQQISTLAHSFGLITLEDATKKALAAKPGVVKEAELEGRKFRSGWDYEFEIVDAEGKEWEVCIDAKTGKVSGMHRDWF